MFIFFKVLLDYLDALVSHINIVYVPHLVIWDPVTLDDRALALLANHNTKVL